jgi:hypothetical protein
MQCPTGVIQIIILVIAIFVTNRIKLRFPVIGCLVFAPIAGAASLIYVNRSQPGSLLAAYYVTVIFGVLRGSLMTLAEGSRSISKRRRATALLLGQP